MGGVEHKTPAGERAIPDDGHRAHRRPGKNHLPGNCLAGIRPPENRTSCSKKPAVNRRSGTTTTSSRETEKKNSAAVPNTHNLTAAPTPNLKPKNL